MTKVEVEAIFEMSTRNAQIACIKLEPGFDVFPGMVISNSTSHQWEITGVVMTSQPKDSTNFAIVPERNKLGYWDCMVKPMDHSLKIQIGSDYTIEWFIPLLK